MDWYVLQQVLISVDLLLAVALIGTATAEVAGPLMRQRALIPSLPSRAGMVAGATDAIVTSALPASPRLGPGVLSQALTRRGLQDRADADPRAQLSVLASTMISIALGLTGVLVLVAGEHLAHVDVGIYVILAVAAIWMMTTAFLWRSTRSDGEFERLKDVMARRGPHLLGTTMLGELLAAAALVLVAVAATHTLGETWIGIPELIAVAVIVSMVVRVVPIPWGLGAADATLILGLLWIGTSLQVATLVAIVWRIGILVSVGINYSLMRVDPGRVDTGERPTDSRIGHLAHRTGFRLLALLPAGARTQVQRRVFNSMMGMSEDPWGYDSMPYEQRKRAALVDAIDGDPDTIVEFGCADGHNLAALSAAFPSAQIIGLDISPNAIAIAERRLAGNPNVRLICTDGRSGWEELARAAPQIDQLIISEVLYYLGGNRAMRESLAPLAGLLDADAVVTFLHGSTDADRLHERASDALRVRISDSTEILDDERPFTVTTALSRAITPSPANA